MNTKTRLLLLLISISFFSCNNTIKNHSILISNIDTDFPTTEKLDFKPFNKFDIFKEGYREIDDSILWSFEEGKSDFGSCYNLNTGEKLATIASKGKAIYELTNLQRFKIIGDSVLLYAGLNTIKTFAKKDIIDNIPMGDRKFSVTVAPDSILVDQMVKLPNGSVLATIQPAIESFQKDKLSEFNQKSVAIFNNKEANSFETINYESFDIEETESKVSANDLIKCAYASGCIGIKDNDMVAFSVSNQFILYTFDIKSGNVINEKRYTKMQYPKGKGGPFVSLMTTNDRNLCMATMKTSNDYILCTVYGYLSEADKNSKLRKGAIFVFDWQLNPIKKFELPKENTYYSISSDCSSVYFCELNDNGLTLHKADLNI